jgi:hypothetical protein
MTSSNEEIGVISIATTIQTTTKLTSVQDCGTVLHTQECYPNTFSIL